MLMQVRCSLSSRSLTCLPRSSDLRISAGRAPRSVSHPARNSRLHLGQPRLFRHGQCYQHGHPQDSCSAERQRGEPAFSAYSSGNGLPFRCTSGGAEQQPYPYRYATPPARRPHCRSAAGTPIGPMDSTRRRRISLRRILNTNVSVAAVESQLGKSDARRYAFCKYER